MTCKVCSHPDRASIENALLSISTDSESININTIAKAYDVTTNDLKIHALMHTPLGVVEEVLNQGTEAAKGQSPRESITRKIKMREADMLLNVANEYMVTLKNMGKRINYFSTQDPKESMAFEKVLTKAVADLYIGLGGEIRATIKTMAEINQMLNGPESTNVAGLSALAQAIKRSANLPEDVEEQ